MSEKGQCTASIRYLKRQIATAQIKVKCTRSIGKLDY